MGNSRLSGPIDSNLSPGSQGLNSIRRYAAGEELEPDDLATMRATMYLLVQLVYPPRDWEDFRWRGPEHFMREIWSKVKDFPELMHGHFSDGAKFP